MSILQKQNTWWQITIPSWMSSSGLIWSHCLCLLQNHTINNYYILSMRSYKCQKYFHIMRSFLMSFQSNITKIKTVNTRIDISVPNTPWAPVSLLSIASFASTEPNFICSQTAISAGLVDCVWPSDGIRRDNRSRIIVLFGIDICFAIEWFFIVLSYLPKNKKSITAYVPKLLNWTVTNNYLIINGPGTK